MSNDLPIAEVGEQASVFADKRECSKDFVKELTELINYHSVDVVAQCHDFILAELVAKLIESIGLANRWRDKQMEK